MSISAIILGLIFSFLILYVTFNIDNIRPKKKYELQDLIDKINSRIAKANGSTFRQSSPENSAEAQRIKRDNLYKKADFINKNCTNLEDFIINDKINGFDLRKLADLNQIKLQICEAWYPLTVELIKELHKNGWDKRVSCIKEKYARLTFYLPDYKKRDELYNIIEEYGIKSSGICEACGAKGEIRYNTSWYYVACRKHYLENRSKIRIENSGFNFNGNFYSWKNVKDACFEDLSSNERYEFLKLEFKKTKVNYQGWNNNKLYISENSIGFGLLLNNLPKKNPSLNPNYLEYFKSPDYCEVCGYKAVYFGKCECCENEIWENLNKWEEGLKKFLEDKERHIKHFGEEKYKKKVEFYQDRINNKEEYKMKDISYSQIRWTLDEGELYESKQNNYPKNPDYKILFNEEQLNRYME